MKKIHSQILSSTLKSDNTNNERDLSGLRGSILKNFGIPTMNSVQSNELQISDQEHDTEIQFTKLANLIKEIFVDIRSKILAENRNIIPSIRTTLPLDNYENNEIMKTDAFTLVHDIREIILAFSQSKNEIEKKLDEEQGRKANEYEPMLQKLEAEARQHIKIEQQMRLYVESTQSKAEELEKQNEQFKKELEGIKQEYNITREKLRKRESENESLRKELKNKTDTIQNLELQTEAILGLKNKIKDLERSSKFESNKLASSTNMNPNQYLGSRENIDIQTKPNQYTSNKTNQLSALLFTGDLHKSRQAYAKNKENIDFIRFDSSKDKESFCYNIKKNNYFQDQKYIQDSSHIDKSGNLTRNEEKSEDIDLKNRRSHKLDITGIKERLPSQDGYNPDERCHSNSRPSSWRENLESTQRNSARDKGYSLKYNSNRGEEYDGEKARIKRTSYNDRQNDNQSCSYYEKKLQNHQGNNIPKPSKANETTSSYVGSNELSSKIIQQAQIKRDNLPYQQEYQQKIISPKKSPQDSRSHSVDGTNKLYRQLKAKMDNAEKENCSTRLEYSRSDIHNNAKVKSSNNNNSNRPSSNCRNYY